MLRVITLHLNEDAPLLDPQIDKAVNEAVALLNPPPPACPEPGDIVITDTHGRVLRIVQYEVCGEINVVDLESQAWW